MNETNFNKLKYLLIATVLFFEIAHLSWEFFNGGVISHHLLARKDMPSVSNWWGLLILPSLAWFCLLRVNKRLTSEKLPKAILTGFFAMLIISIAQSLAFKFGYSDITKYLALGVLIGGLFLPIFRAECVFGHVLGATFAFGPVIPMIGITIMASISAFSYFAIRPLLLRIVKPTKEA